MCTRLIKFRLDGGGAHARFPGVAWRSNVPLARRIVSRMGFGVGLRQYVLVHKSLIDTHATMTVWKLFVEICFPIAFVLLVLLNVPAPRYMMMMVHAGTDDNCSPTQEVSGSHCKDGGPRAELPIGGQHAASACCAHLHWRRLWGNHPTDCAPEPKACQ